MKKIKQDFFTTNGEGIKIMTFGEFARHILRMECGESLDIYIKADRESKECSVSVSCKKEFWNGTPFYLLGGDGREVRVVNYAGRSEKEFETICYDTLDSYDAVETIGIVVSRLKALSPEELHTRITEEIKTGCKCLFVYQDEEEMTAALDGKVYAISDFDGCHLCDLYESDFVALTDEGAIVDTTPIKGMSFFSDWAIANPGERAKVLSRRMAVIYIHSTITV